MPNGLGPYWFPSAWRAGLTRVSSLYFDECNWSKHDEGYERRAPDRATCDRLMLAACLRDSSRTSTIPRMLACTALSWAFWALVRCFGWASWHFPNNQTAPISEDMNIMTTEKREQQIADMSEEQLLHLNQKCMRDLETIWKVAAQRLDERAGSDRIGHNAVSSACFLGVHFKLKALHCEMDALAAQAGDVPVARSGER